MVKIFVALLVVVAVAGSAIGYLNSARSYAWTGENFGYFSKQGELQAKDLMAHLMSMRQEGLAKVEVVGGEDFHFGSMLRDARGEHEFIVKNLGDAVLELSVLSTTCKCTIGELDDSSLEPGESTVLRMVWNAKTGGARFQQTATITTTDPYKGELQLRIMGTVLDPLSASPSSWNAGEISDGTPIGLSSTVYNRWGFDVKWKETRWLEEIPGVDVHVDVQGVPVDSATALQYPDTRQAFEVQLKVSPGMKPGLFSYMAVLDFEPVDPASVPEEDATNLELVITLEGRVVGDMSLSGGSRMTGRDGGRYLYTIPPVSVGEGTTDSLLLFLRGPHRETASLSIGDVDPSNVLQAELGEPKIKDKLVIYPLKLSIRQDAPAMERNGNRKDDYGTVQIQADNDEVAPLLLRVKFNVRDGR